MGLPFLTTPFPTNSGQIGVDLGVDLMDLGVDLVDLEVDLVDVGVDLMDLEMDLVDLVDWEWI